MNLRKLVCLSTAAVVALPVIVSVPSPGWAQVDELLVTVRKREEALQDIPIAVTAFDLTDIQRKDIARIEDVSMLSSSLQFEQAGNPDSNKLVIRGLSPTRGRQNIAILMNGFDLSSESIAQNGSGAQLNTRTSDLERIEIAKGPQSAIFGRSAFAGAIQIVTRDPSEEWELEGGGEIGNHDRYEANLSISGPIAGDVLGMRLSGAWWDEEGFYDNARTGDKVGGTKGFDTALSVKFQPTDNLWFKLRGAYNQQYDQQSPTVLVPGNLAVSAPDGACIDQNPATVAKDAVFPCRGFGDGTTSPAATRQAWGFGMLTPAQIEAFEAALNPNGIPLVAGPITPSNLPPHMNTGSLATGDLAVIFDGVIPKQSELGDVYLTPDPRTGEDFPGLYEDGWNVTLRGEWELDFGTISSWTGYNQVFTHSIQDWQSAGNPNLCGTFVRPDSDGILNVIDPGPADSCVINYNNNQHDLDQWSQELRFASDWDFWTQLTVGGLRWFEDRDFYDKGGTIRARSIDCVMSAAGAVVGPCGVFSVPITGDIFQQVVAARRTVFGGLLDGQNGSRETKHWSAYFLTETNLNDMWNDMMGAEFLPGQWSIVLEGRWNHESTDIIGMDSSGSGSTGVNICGGGPVISSSHTAGAGAEAFASNACNGVPIANAAGPLVVGPAAFPPSHTGGPPLVTINDIQWSPLGPVFTSSLASFGVRPCNFSDAEIAAMTMATASTTVLNCDGEAGVPFKRGITDANWWTGKATLQWEPSDNSLLYFYHAWAQKPAGFNTVNLGSRGLEPSSDLFKAEKMRVYELGAKTAWFENQLIVNVAGFFQDFSDKQVSTQILVPDPIIIGSFSTSPATVNASGAEIWGTELDVVFAPNMEIFGGRAVIGGSYTWLDATYTDFELDTPSGADIFVVGNCTPNPQPGVDGMSGTSDDTPSCLVSRNGFPMEDAPTHAANISSSWVAPLWNTGYDWFIETDTQYTGKRALEDDNRAFAPAWWNTNLRIGLQNENFSILGFVNNVFEGDNVQRAHTIPGLGCCFNFVHLRREGGGPTSALRGGPAGPAHTVAATLRPPRHFGIRASFKF